MCNVPLPEKAIASTTQHTGNDVIGGRIPEAVSGDRERDPPAPGSRGPGNGVLRGHG